MTTDTPEPAQGLPTPPETFDEFLKSSRVGYIYATPDGKITRANDRVAKWLNVEPASLTGTAISDHFPISGKIYFQTHLVPLLKMQGFFEEVALELAPSNASRIPVLVTGVERTNEKGAPLFIRMALLPAIERRKYERNIVAAKSAAVADNTRLREVNTNLEGNLSEERQTAALREQFVAVLGHDLRNPLAAIDGGLRLVRKTPLNDRALAITDMMQTSIARMATLIDDVMDFARGRLGSGIEIKVAKVDLTPVLNHAVEELRVTWPDRVIDTSFVLPLPVNCDAKRVAQLLSNLLANALTHGASEGPILVRASQENGFFELSVSNGGEPIPAVAIERLFEPFTREDIRPSQQGLGLGLYIASQIAKAHRGSLSVRSSHTETRFTLLIPID